jgi:hypothetical protein
VIETGADGSGDITREENLLHCSGKYGATMDLVTADGGFDFSGDFNHQENQVGLLLVAQLAMASAVQKQGGTLIMKMFDLFTKLSVDIVYILSLMYDKVSIVKPNTSRYANSERYVVAQGFRSPDGRLDWAIQFAPILERIPVQPFQADTNSDDGEHGFEKPRYKFANILRLVDDAIPRYFITRIEESSASIGQQQMDNISSTLALIKNPRQEKMERMRIASIQRCVVWCQKHDLPYNRDVRHFNMFLSAKNKVSRVPKKNLLERSADTQACSGQEMFDCDLPDVLDAMHGGDVHVKQMCEQMVNAVVNDSLE